MNKDRVMFWLRRHPALKSAAAIPYRTYHSLKNAGRETAAARESVRRLAALPADAAARIWHICVPTHPNLGDQAQALCIGQWLAENYPGREIVRLDSVSFRRRTDEHMALLREKLGPDDIIVFQSGYTCKDKHPDNLAHIRVVEAFRENRIVFFPQSIRLDGPERADYVRAFAVNPNVTMLARDETSLTRARVLFPRARLLLFPDIVTTQIGLRRFDGARDGVLFCMRSDDEQAFSPAQLDALARGLGVSGPVTRTDTTGADFDFSTPESTRAAMEQTVARYAAYRLIVTDRYHGTILALAAGTPVLVLRTADHKVAEGARWLAGVWPRCLRIAERPQDAPALARELLDSLPEPPAEPLFRQRYYDRLKALLDSPPEPPLPCEPALCTGCMLCRSVCPRGAIGKKADEKGFFVPVIRPELCVDCGQCREACPANALPPRPFAPTFAMAAWTQNEAVRAQSSSGGVFYGLACEALAAGGAVCGAAFDPDGVLRHRIVRSREELAPLLGSKYVQSDASGVYAPLRALLETGQTVLFVGTPCQVAAVKRFTRGAGGTLYTADLVCHGAPSPRVFADYLKTVGAGHGGAAQISFRHKEPSWRVFSMRIRFEDGTVRQLDAQHDPYLVSFLNDYTLRDCCHACAWAGAAREGDVTLGDFWGYISQTRALRNTEKGVSAVFANTEQGRRLLEGLAGYVKLPTPPEAATDRAGPLARPTAMNARAPEFWSDYAGGASFGECAGRYFYPRRVSRRYRLGCWCNDHAYLLPKGARRLYERLRDRLKRL